MTVDQKFVFRTLASHKSALSNFGVRKLGLFGSFVRDQQSEDSDIDILVEFKEGKKNADSFLDLAFFLEDVFHKKVDLLTPESLTPGMKNHISNEVKYFPFDKEYLGHILLECEFLVSEAEKTDSIAFGNDEVLKRAFSRSLEIIGEAAKKLSIEFRQAHDVVDWKKIAGMRDKIIHDYLGVDYDLVWDVVRNRIPELKSQTEKMKD